MSLLFLLCDAFAQGNISGRLLDEEGNAVEFANIAIRAIPDGNAVQGGIANDKGEFTFPVGDGRFTLMASSIGYQTLTITCSAGDLGDLTMPRDIEQLESVTVQAQRIVEKAGRFLVVPDPRDVDVCAKGIDLLDMQQLPGLKVDRALGSIKVDGGDPVFKINGKEVQPNRLINLNPEKVKRIEYSNSPGLRYLDRGSTGIINIVLKEPDDGGSIFLDAGTDPQLMMSDAYFNGSYHKGKSEFALEYYFSRRNYKHGPSEDDDFYIAPERVVERHTRTECPVYYMVNNINAEYTFQPNDSTMFVASLKNSIFESNQKKSSGTMVKTDRGVSTTTTITGARTADNFDPALDLFYTQKFGKGRKLELNVVGQFNKSEMSRTLNYTSGGSTVSYPTDVRNHGYAISAEGVYGKQFSKLGTRWGVQYQHNYAANDYVVSGVKSQMTKDNTYIFGQAEGPVGEKVNWTVGTGAKLFSVKDGSDSKIYVRNLSTAQINLRLDSHWSMTGEVRYTPSLPSLGDLSPVFQRTDDVEATQGFSGLKPSQNLDGRLFVRFASSKGWFVDLQGGYRHDFGEIITTYRYDAASDLFVTTPQNSEFYNKLYLSAETGVKNLFEHINISLDGKLMREQTKGDGFHHINDNFCLNINVQTVWNKFTAGAYFTIVPEWSLQGEFLWKSEPGQNIYAQYKWKNLTAHLSWHCPFNPKGYDYETIYLSEIHPGRHINWTMDNGNMIVLGLTWDLNFGTAFKKGWKTLQNGGYDAGTVM